MKIGWWVGKDVDWAFLHFARSVQSKVTEHTHLFNEQGDVNIVASLAFLPKLNSYENYITRISGHRIFTNYGVHFNFLESLTIGWWVGDTQWAFRYLAEHIQDAVSEHTHVENTKGDVNIVLDPVTLMAHSADTSYIMHLDGNRFFEDRGVYFD